MPDDDDGIGQEFGDDFEDVWSSIPGSSWLEEQPNEVLETAQNLLYVGWFDGDASYEERHSARVDFAEYTGLGYVDEETGDLHLDLFPWDEWREVMGYE